MQTQRMLRAQGLYQGRIDGVMNRQTQAALTRFHHGQKATHRVATLQQHRNSLATLQKQHKPAGQELGAGASRQTEHNTMSGSSQNDHPDADHPARNAVPERRRQRPEALI